MEIRTDGGDAAAGDGYVGLALPALREVHDGAAANDEVPWLGLH
jgi:hypothetical protein